MLWLPLKKQAEILKGWWRGDKGYTSSCVLANQMKVICLRLGIIPCIHIDTVAEHRKRGKHRIGDRKIRAKFNKWFGPEIFKREKFGNINNPENPEVKKIISNFRGLLKNGEYAEAYKIYTYNRVIDFNDAIRVHIEKLQRRDADGRLAEMRRYFK